MKFLIPSYKRAGRATSIDFLVSMHVPYEDILVGVQTKEDHEAYGRCYNHVPLLLNDAHNCAGNRNALIDTLKVGEKCILLDDDLGYITRIREDGRTSSVSTPHDFWRFIEAGFGFAGDGIWAPKYTSNYANQAIRRWGDFQRVCLPSCGAFIGFTKDKEDSVRYNEDLPFFDDLEAALRAIFHFGKRPGKLTRYVAKNPIPAVIPKTDIVNPSSGGCAEAYAEAGAEQRREVVEDIISRYPGVIEFIDPDNPLNTNTKLTSAGRKAIEVLWA